MRLASHRAPASMSMQYADDVELQQSRAGPSRRRQSASSTSTPSSRSSTRRATSSLPLSRSTSRTQPLELRDQGCEACRLSAATSAASAVGLSTSAAPRAARRRRTLRASAMLLVASVLVVHPLSLLPGARAAPAPDLHPAARQPAPAHAASAQQGTRGAAQSTGVPAYAQSVQEEMIWQRARVQRGGGDEGADRRWRLEQRSDEAEDDVGNQRSASDEQQQQLDASSPLLQKRDDTPTRTLPLLPAMLLATSSGRLQASAFTSGLVSTWRPATRSVWFQKKAVIITAVFLAIFIVLIIGAAVFLRDRADDEEEDERAAGYGDLRDYDERAIERMRDERRMRSAGRGEDGKEKSATQGKKSWRKRRPTLSSEKEGSYGTVGSRERSSGDSTAVSRRLVTRWVKAPARRLRGRRSNEDNDDAASLDAAAVDGDAAAAHESRADDAASVHTHSSRRRGPRLGDGVERVEIAYDDDGEEARNTSAAAADASSVPDEPPPPLPPLSPTASSNGAAALRPSMDSRALSDSSSSAQLRAGSAGTGAAGLDDSDFSAVDMAEQAARAAGEPVEEVMPPAYISSRALGSQATGGAAASSSSRVPMAGVLASPARALAGSEPPPHPSVDPALAGRGALDAKRADGGLPSDPSHFDDEVTHSAGSASSFIGALLDADAQRSAGTSSSRQEAAYAAHVATDDKAVLSALREAASAPSAVGASAPSYDHDVAAPAAPASTSRDPLAGEASAPHMHAFEHVDAEAGSSSLDTTAQRSTQRNEKGKMTLLPPPPLHAPYSRFDLPYAPNEWSPVPTSSASFAPSAPQLPSAPPALDESASSSAAEEAEEAAHARKRLEVEREELQLRASDPAEYAARSTTGGLALPAYEHASAPPSAALEQPSAPGEEELDEGSSLPVGDREGEGEGGDTRQQQRQRTYHAPSAPPL